MLNGQFSSLNWNPQSNMLSVSIKAVGQVVMLHITCKWHKLPKIFARPKMAHSNQNMKWYILYSAIIGWGKILVKSLPWRNGGEIFGESSSK